jgi:ABC-type spermidine/putrescine transport system permease subunit II
MSLLAQLARLGLRGVVGLILVYLVLPTLVIVPMSFSGATYLAFPPESWSLGWYRQVAENPAWQNAAGNSLVIGLSSALIATVLGTLVALALARGRIVFAGLVSAIVVAPMMLPHIILAIGLYPVMLDLGALRTYTAAILGHAVIALPLVFITVSAALKSYGGSLELAAMTLGANPWQSFWRVTFPMIRTSVIVGAILAFATSFDELLLSLFLTGTTTRTLPRLIWEQLSDFLTPAIAAVATLVFAFSLVLLAVAALLQRRPRSSVGAFNG